MSPVPESRPGLLLVHGAWHGSWCWEDVQRELTDRGWDSRAIDLPSSVPRGSTGRLPGLFEDTSVIRESIDAMAGPVVVVGHSYGGAPVTQATADAVNVVHIVYVAGFPLDVGESMLSLVGAPHPDPERVEGVMASRTGPRSASSAMCPRTCEREPCPGCRRRALSPSRIP